MYVLNFKKFNENFYYDIEDPIEIFFKSYYDFFINLKILIISEEHKIEYFTNNIKDCFKKLSGNLLHKLSSKKIDILFSEFKKLKSLTDEKVMDITKLEDFLNNLKQKTGDIDSEKVNIKKILVNYQKSLDNILSSIVDYAEKKIEEDKKWEIIKGLVILQSKIDHKYHKKLKYLLQIEFLKLQEYIKEKELKVLVTFDGRDTAGKSAACEIISQYLNPKNARVETFGIPTKNESKNWFKRYEEKLPSKGELVLFDRSWYTRSYVENPLGYCNKEQYDNFMDEVIPFEEKLKDEKIILIKIWLSVNQETQKLRFELRKSNPLKYWKFSQNDRNIVNRWNEFSPCINKMIKKTNLKSSPWIIIDSNDEGVCEIELMKSILQKFDYPDKISDVNKDTLTKESWDSLTPAKATHTNHEKYIFLDIDGVIIPFKKESKVDHSYFDEKDEWSKDAIENLNELFNKYPNANIIIISSYSKTKTIHKIQHRFNSVRLRCRVAGLLPPIRSEYRFTGVDNFIKRHRIKNYVIIDDQEHDIVDVPQLKNNWCHVNIKDGFSKKDLEKAIEILK